MANNNYKDFDIMDGVLTKYNGADENIVIPDDVKIIGEKAFVDNRKIVAVDLNNVEEVRADAFHCCYNLNTLVAPNVVTVGVRAFKHCDLTSAMFGKIKTIAEYAFFGCHISDISGTEGLESIGNSAFESNRFTEFHCPDLKFMGSSAFGCCKLKSFTMPKAMTSVPACAFSGCESLRKVTLHDGITKIEYGAFFGSGLRQIVIPKNVTAIEGCAFERVRLSYVQNLSKIYIKIGSGRNGRIADNAYAVSTDPPDVVDNFVFCTSNDGVSYLIDYIDEPTGTLVLPADYKGGTYEIGRLAFECLDIKSVVLGDGVTAIGNRAFFHCTNLTDVTFGKNVKRVDRLGFKGSPLRAAVLPEVEYLGIGAFFLCELDYIVLGKNLKKICGSVFDHCGTLDNIYYLGTPQQALEIEMSSASRGYILAHMLYYSETKPSDAQHKYWHYVNGKIEEY